MFTNTFVLVAIGIAVYAGALIAVGLFSARKEDHGGFVIGNRNVGLPATVASYASGWRDVSFIWFWIALAYTNGYAILIWFPAQMIGAALMAFVAPKIRQKAHERNYITVGRMIEDHVGPISRYLVAILLVIIMLLFAGSQLMVLGRLCEGFLGISSDIVVPFFALIVAFYMWAGGYGSVIKTDLIQFVVLLSLVSAPFFIPVSHETLTDWPSFGSFGWQETLAMGLMSFLYAFVSPDQWQRLYSARDDRVARWTHPLGLTLAFFVTVGLIFIGFAARDLMPDASPDDLVQNLLTEQYLPPVLLALLVLVMASMCMSTLDTQTYIFTSTLLRDFLRLRVREEQDKKRYVKISRILLVLFLIVATILATSLGGIMETLMGILGIFGMAVPAYIICAFGFVPPSRALDLCVSASMLTALAVFFYMFVNGLTTSFTMSVIPMLISLLPSMFAVAVLYIKNRATNAALPK